MNRSHSKILLWFSIPLAALVSIASVTGLVTPGFYEKETPNWQAQSAGQDMVNLFLVVPALLISCTACRNRRKAIYVWAGIVMYLLYTFAIYCFAVHFNRMFLVYCLSMGLAFYSILWLLVTQLRRQQEGPDVFNHAPHRFTGIYFIVLAGLFYILWLAEIIPAVLRRQTPASVEATGLLTNAVHVLDLSVFLPGVLITGILILKRRRTAYFMAPVLLSFFVLMDITIGVLVVIMKQRGVEADYSVTIMMAVFTLLSLVLLLRYMKK